MSKIEDYLSQSPELMPSVVGYILQGNEVLLGERLTSSTDLGIKLLVGLGGGREMGETDEEAFNREVLEESSLTVLRSQDMGQVIFIFPDKPKWTQRVKIFLVKEDNWHGKPKKTASIKPVWVASSELPFNRMWPDNAIWVPEVLKGNKVNGIFLLDLDGNILEQQFEVLPENS